ncbi:MAG: matrixin family metalloprotease, partial [Planctomycetota bacterium]|nr:matrixin family metalloprotease [Planctomycetota bacterium]
MTKSMLCRGLVCAFVTAWAGSACHAEAAPAAAAARTLDQLPCLADLLDESSAVFEAIVVGGETGRQPGSRLLATEYTLNVVAYLKGAGPLEARYRTLGGALEDGSTMIACNGWSLRAGDHLLVFVDKLGEGTLHPFLRVLRVLEDGAALADESGRLITSLEGGVLRAGPRVARPLGSAEWSSGVAALRSGRGVGEEAAVPGVLALAEEIWRLEPPADVAASRGSLEPRGPALEEAGDIERRSAPFLRSATPGRSTILFRGFLPGADEFRWTSESLDEWNSAVQGRSLMTFARDGSGRVVRNEFPDERIDDVDVVAVLTGEEREEAGFENYGPRVLGETLWTETRSGVMINRWVFVKPTDDEDLFRQVMLHELGHGIGLGHEEDRVAIMNAFSGAPYNARSDLYLRRDDLEGLRSNLRDAGGWAAAAWTDIATYNFAQVGGERVRSAPSHQEVSRGNSLEISNVYVENRGTVPARNVELTVYLSTDDDITTSDLEVGRFPLGTVSTSVTRSVRVNLDAAASDGPRYRLGWIVSTSSSDLERDNNVTIMNDDFNEARQLSIASIPGFGLPPVATGDG